MRCLLVERSVARFAAARVVSGLAGPARGARFGPLRLAEQEPPPPPGPSWWPLRPILSGICGSDLHLLDARSSRYFEPLVSFPFVPGHEVVALVEDGPLAGRRVVLEPVLGCATRGIDPPCAACAAGEKGRCQHVAYGHLAPGLQTGFCADTGGGWSERLVAHESQLHPVPDDLDDEAAVLVEPTACAVHAALRPDLAPGSLVAVVGAGTLGLLVVAALAALRGVSPVAVAKHPAQRELAASLGAGEVVEPGGLLRLLRRRTGSLALARDATAPESLTGGADVVFDCVGSAESIAQALAALRPGGELVLVGMPGRTTVDLAPLWQRELRCTGAYTYGVEDLEGARRPTFAVALELVGQLRLGRLVSACYPLERFDDALLHAAEAGRRGATKVVFDPRRPLRARAARTTPRDREALP